MKTCRLAPVVVLMGLFLAERALAYEVSYFHVNADGAAVSLPNGLPVPGVLVESTGVYLVIFQNPVTSIGIPLVTARGTGSNWCKFDSFTQNSVRVRCFNSSGQAAASGFTVVMIPPQNDRELYYAYADSPGSASYTPTYRYNPSGTVTVTRSSAGRYQVVFQGVTSATPENLQVSAVGVNNLRCHLTAWSATTPKTVNVACGTPAGTLSDSAFVVALAPTVARPRALAYSWVSTNFYSPGGGGSRVGDGQGNYTVTFTGLNLNRYSGNHVAIVSAYQESPGSPSTTYCVVGEAAAGNGTDVTIPVRCYTNGVPAPDVDFSILVIPVEFLRNAGFEAPPPANPLLAANTGWTMLAGSPVVERTGPTTDDGKQWVRLNNGGNAVIKQSVGTVPGAGYKISFDFANASGLPSSSVRVKWGGQTVSTPVRTATTFQNYTVDVYATGNTTELQFESLGSADLLDDVRVIYDPSAPPPPSVTVTTSPAGQQITVDGASYTAPQTFYWGAGSQHSLSIASVINLNANSRLVFSQWTGPSFSNNNATVNITAPAVSGTYTANLTTQHRLTVVSNPVAGGSVTANPVGSGGFYDAGSTVQLTAAANSGYVFSSFSTLGGAVTSPFNPSPVTISGATTVTANFAACSYSINPTSATAVAAGGSGQVTVTAPAGCPWNVTGGSSWLLPGAVNGNTVSYTVAANTGTASRTASLTIAGIGFSVTQAGTSPCNYTLNTNSANVPAVGGTASFTVTTGTSCAWTADFGTSWIFPSGASNYTGTATVSYAVAANAGGQRSFSLTVAGQTVTITQLGAAGSQTSGLRFVALEPCRILETRSDYNFPLRTGEFGPPFLNAGTTRTLNPKQYPFCTVPASAKAYVLNVTLIPRPGGVVDYATVWPAGDPRPNVHTVRTPDGQIVANSQIVAAGANGAVSVYVSHNADLLLDISGYFTDDPAVSNLVFYPVTPCRVVETRSDYRPGVSQFGPPSMASRQTRSIRFPLSTDCPGIPAAAAYSVTLTVVPPAVLPFLTTWQTGIPQPNVSSINSFVGRTLANNVIVPANALGSIDVYAYEATDFLMDINGYFAPDDGVKGQFYFPVTQCRMYDTMTANGPVIPNSSTRTISPLTSACAGIGQTARGYAINVTAVPNGNPMPFITVFPTGSAQPNASVLNAFQGQTVTNFAIVPSGTNGQIDLYAYRQTHAIVEINGYFGR